MNFNKFFLSTLLSLSFFHPSIAESSYALSNSESIKGISKRREKVHESIKEEIGDIRKLVNKDRNTKINNFSLEFDTETIDIILNGIDSLPLLSKTKLDVFWEGWINFGESKKSIENTIFSLPEAGIREISLYKIGESYRLRIVPMTGADLNKPEINYSSNALELRFKRPFNQIKSLSDNVIKDTSAFAVTDNLDDIKPQAELIKDKLIVLNSKYYTDFKGPNISLELSNASPNDTLIAMAKLGGYSFIYSPNTTNKEGNQILSKGITLSLNNQPYSVALNAVINAANYKIRKVNDLVIFGHDVYEKDIGKRVSKTYRLNQANANSTADYLANLGVEISLVIPKKIDTDGDFEPDTVVPFLSNIESSKGPLKGISGAIDKRLQSITLTGDENLIKRADHFIEGFDSIQKQVALSIKILDVNLEDDKTISNSFALKYGDSFFLSDGGMFSAIFDRQMEDWKINNATGSGMNSRSPENYIQDSFADFFSSKITASDTRVLANPTLILSENPDPIEGGGESSADISDEKLRTTSIGRPFANQAFITVGDKVITDVSVTPGYDGRGDTCDPQFSVAGLTLGARVHKIDDNGFVTFSLSPEMSTVSSVYSNTSCGSITISALNIRRLDTGTVRVKDGQTLILSGVVSKVEVNSQSKLPLLGDLPLLGSIFRKNIDQDQNRELVIMVAPRLIN